MKKTISLLLAAVMLLALAACGKSDPNAPDAPKDNTDRGTVTIFVDGKETAKLTYADIAKKADSKNIDGNYYFGITLSDGLKDVDFSTVKAAFIKTADDQAGYTDKASDLFLSAFKADAQKVYQSIADEDGKACFNLMNGTEEVKGVSEIYLLSKPVDFSVEITKDGEPYKTVTISDFMEAAPTYMTLSHKYNGGADAFEGSFLALDSDAMCKALGIEYSEGNGLEIYKADGTMNKELSNDPDAEKSVWKVYYYVLVDGADHSDISGSDIGLSCLSNGTGMRWMVNDISKINWVTVQKTEPLEE